MSDRNVFTTYLGEKAIKLHAAKDRFPADLWDDKRWCKYGFKLDKPSGGNDITTGYAPKKWTHKKSGDGKFGLWCDPNGVEKVSYFIKTSHYDPKSRTEFL